MLNCALVIEIVSNSFSESKERSNWKKLRYGMKNIFPLDFIKYQNFSEVQKNKWSC